MKCASNKGSMILPSLFLVNLAMPISGSIMDPWVDRWLGKTIDESSITVYFIMKSSGKIYPCLLSGLY